MTPANPDTIEAKAREEAERLVRVVNGWHVGIPARTQAAVAARIAQSLSYESELVTAGTELGREIAELKEQLADAQREIERLKAAAWATLTIADMTVPQIVAMKQENAALRRALAEAKQAIADFLAGEDEAIVHLKEMGVVKLHEQFPLVDALRRALAGKEE